ncbi:MAG: glycosyltransferase family 2 protein [Pseudooceanicola sp.]
MQSTACAITMLRDDLFFLEIWLRHYGGMLGRENCYVIAHGREPDVLKMAEGCNIIGLPGEHHKNFDMKRWRLLNNLVNGLNSYYKHVIVGDVDELVVIDPSAGKSLLDWLEDAPERRVFTPLGLEVLHQVDVEDEAITDHVLGPRRHVRVATHYSKPCVISTGTKIARGGHFAQFDKLFTPDVLFMFHLKFVDFGAYCAVMDRRNAVTEAVQVDSFKDASIGRHWFAEARGEDRAVFEAFADIPMQPEFDMRPIRKAMQRSWKARGATGFWEFDRPDYNQMYVLPDRFVGAF